MPMNCFQLPGPVKAGTAKHSAAVQNRASGSSGVARVKPIWKAGSSMQIRKLSQPALSPPKARARRVCRKMVTPIAIAAARRTAVTVSPPAYLVVAAMNRAIIGGWS